VIIMNIKLVIIGFTIALFAFTSGFIAATYTVFSIPSDIGLILMFFDGVLVAKLATYKVG
jgi:hypothetical protein